MTQTASNTHRFIRKSWLAWILCGLISLSTLIQLFIGLTNLPADEKSFKIAGGVAFKLIPVAFAVVGALILSRQPRNTIGWLLIIPGIVTALPIEDYVNSFASPPSTPPFSLLLALWLNTWGWILLIFPILFIPLLFPTGQPPSPRWRWLIVFGLAMCAFFILLTTFQQNFTGGDLSVKNPIGFIPDDDELWQKYFNLPWGIALISLTVLCVVSLFVRYRRATAVEREQIKWLLYACGLFVAVYIPLYWISDLEESIFTDIFDFLFDLSILAFPIAIAIAILRYRLFDIDVLIRRTLVYGALSLTLALVYFGGVVLLQAIFEAITGQGGSPVATVISTLGIAALFTPLRRRIQHDIDRRFYRRKYDAEKTLAAFAQTARDETRLEALVPALLEAVQDSLQPEQAWLWLKER